MTQTTPPFNFLAHTPQERQAMLETLGLQNIGELFSDIPAGLRQDMTYRLLRENGLSEAELQAELKRFSAENQASQYSSFLGGGAYHRFIPMAVSQIASRSEFYTAYTPYQPEVSQGTLQVIYEFQTMIAELTGLDVANASVYDGGTAVSEAAMMAVRATRRNDLWIQEAVHPQYQDILQTYVNGLGELRLHRFNTVEELQKLSEEERKKIAGVIIQQPDYLGRVNGLQTLRSFCDQTGALLIASCDPIALGTLTPPPADIIVGDIQPLGNHLAYGGPYGGFMATTHKLMRQLPGRLVGKTVDKHGIPCYTLTLQTREQHIRREKATSNICTNQALNVLRATVYLSLVGPQGLKKVAQVSGDRGHWLAQKLTQLPGVSLRYPETLFISEFVLRITPDIIRVADLLTQLEQRGILGGLDLGKRFPELSDCLLVSVTELNTPSQLEQYVTAMREFFGQPVSLPISGKQAQLC